MALNALDLAALVMAVQSPLALCDVGFQLSLIVIATPLTTACQQWLVRRPFCPSCCAARAPLLPPPALVRLREDQRGRARA